jgi:hypothetical protein
MSFTDHSESESADMDWIFHHILPHTSINGVYQIEVKLIWGNKVHV